MTPRTLPPLAHLGSALGILDDVDRLADIQGRIREMTAEADSIKARLRDDYRDTPGVHDIGAHKVTVTPTARFSEDQARAAWTALAELERVLDGHHDTD